MSPPRRILIVDDHAILRQGLRALIENVPGFTVCGEAADGRQGIEQALRLKPDLVLMDIVMPVMSGLDATKEIKRVLPTAKVIILSLHESPALAEQGRQAGASASLSKSSGLDVLVDAIRSILSGLAGSAEQVVQATGEAGIPTRLA